MNEDNEAEGSGLGFMEFFDWMVDQADQMLIDAAKRLGIEVHAHEAAAVPLTRQQRWDIGLAVWQAS